MGLSFQIQIRSCAFSILATKQLTNNKKKFILGENKYLLTIIMVISFWV